MSFKIAHTFLMFYYLTSQKYTNCQQDASRRTPTTASSSVAPQNSLLGSFAQVQRINAAGNADGDLCGAVWIDKTSLLTAASCLDDVWSSVDDLMSTSYKVNVIPMLKFEGLPDKDGKKRINYIKEAQSSRFSAGQAILHPLFNRTRHHNNNKLPEKNLWQLIPLAYDVALVKVIDNKVHDIEKLDLCKEENVNKDAIARTLSTWTALALEYPPIEKNSQEKIFGLKVHEAQQQLAATNGRVHEWQQLKQFSTAAKEPFGLYRDRKVYIDPYKQFTINFNKVIPELNNAHGVPILTSEKASVRCIAGIMSYSGLTKETEDEVQYITSTKVYTEEIQEWIKHAQDIMKKMGTQGIPKYQDNKGDFAKTKLEKDAQKDTLIEVRSRSGDVISFIPGCPHDYPRC